jgi:UV DNA damage endonuclease
VRLGFAVKVLGEGGMPSHDARRWRSGPHLRNSIEYLLEILDYLDRRDIRMYRMATALAPYASHPDLPQFHGQVEECAGELAQAGSRARSLGIRLSTHPGQYTVLNSQDERVRDAAVAELEVQAELFDAMGLGPESVVVVHVGGAAGGVEAATDRFEAGFERLSEGARKRLAIENDDRSFGFAEALEVARLVGRPLVFDIHHHHCLDREGVPDREALELALASWPADVLPKIHFSSPRLDVPAGGRLPELRAHADLVDPIAFELFLRHTAKGLAFDVMLEAKAKDLALLRLRDQLAARGLRLAGRPEGVLLES